jgi:hypothetical protein
LAKCISQRITVRSFHVPANQVIYSSLIGVYTRLKTTAIEVLAEHLKTTRQLDEIGGFGYLMQVSARIPTTAQADYFIEKVRELAVLREIIVKATAAVEKAYLYQGDLAAFVGDIESDMADVFRQSRGESTWDIKSFVDLELPPRDDTTLLLGKWRYLYRGATAFVVGPSHVGKSSLCFQWAVEASLGRSFLGIPTHGKLKVLIVNGEDDEYDGAEVNASLIDELQLTEEQKAEVRQRVFWTVSREETGDEFFATLTRAIAKSRPDIVAINPLNAFNDLDITKPAEATKLRKLLNKANPTQSFAWMIYHHTNKPPGATQAKVERNWNEHMYNMTGAADLTNMARVVINIEPQEEQGEFKIRLSKRGKRAGVEKRVAASPGAMAEYGVEIVTEIAAKHSKRVLKLEDGRTIPVQHWSTSDYVSPAKDAKAKKTIDLDFAEFRQALASKFSGQQNARPAPALYAVAHMVKTALPKKAFDEMLTKALSTGELAKSEKGYYLPPT